MNWSAQTDGNWVYVEPGWVEQRGGQLVVLGA